MKRGQAGGSHPGALEPNGGVPGACAPSSEAAGGKREGALGQAPASLRLCPSCRQASLASPAGSACRCLRSPEDCSPPAASVHRGAHSSSPLCRFHIRGLGDPAGPAPPRRLGPKTVNSSAGSTPPCANRPAQSPPPAPPPPAPTLWATVRLPRHPGRLHETGTGPAPRACGDDPDQPTLLGLDGCADVWPETSDPRGPALPGGAVAPGGRSS